MPLWSVEEWRVRVGTPWAALGRTFPSCQSSHKEWRHRPSRGGGGGGPMVVSTTVSLTVAQPAMDAGHSHSVSRYHSNKCSGSWKHTSHMATAAWKKLFSWSSVKKLAGAPLPKDLSLSRKNIWSAIFTFSVLALSLVVALQLERATFLASLLARCGDIEPNPGPLGREELEKVDNSQVLTEDDFKTVHNEVQGIKCAYYQLGRELGLKPGDLESIWTTYHQLIDQAIDQVLLKWLKQCYDVQRHGHPTWRRLVEAVDSPNGGDNPALAKDIANRHLVPGATPLVSQPQEQSLVQQSQQLVSATHSTPLTSQQASVKGQAVTKKALIEVKADFSSVLLKVQSSMEGCKIPVKKVRRFLVGFFEGECSIPKGDDMDDIFDAITEARLWRYDHYEPLEKLAVEFLPEDDQARAKVTEYKSQLSAFQATTSIIDFIKLNELEDREEIPDRMFSPKKYNSHYQKLSVTLEVARNSQDVFEQTLEYVDKLWKLLAKEFRLPPLTAIIDRIVEGSLKITWLLLPHIIEKIRATYFKSIEFLQQHNIIRIDLYGDSDGDDGLPLYDEEDMVTGSTPLFRASFTGDIDEVKNLLEGGANVDEENNNDDGYTPLIGACVTGQDDIARLLLRYRAAVDYLTKGGESALVVASGYNHPSTALVLLEHGAKVDLSDDEDEVTPLMYACVFGSTATVRVLLEHGANVDLCNKDGRSALMAASITGQKETVEVLLEYGAQVNRVDNNGWSALDFAVEIGYADTARLLLENRATMNFEDDVWKEALHSAIEEGFSEVVSVMLEYGAPVDIIFNHEEEKEGNGPLSVACEHGQAETARVLLDHGATPDHQNKRGRSGVHLASEGGHVETMKVLLEKSPQLDLQDEDGWTALLLAVQQGHLEIVKLLLERGAAVDTETKSGLTALKVARSEGRQDICDMLQFCQQGLKVTPSTQPAESTAVKPQLQGAEVDSPSPSEDTQQEKRESPEKEKDGETNKPNTELTEAQTAEVRSVSERLWKQFKKIFLSELVKKEAAAEMRRESEHIIAPTKQSRNFFSRLFPRRGQRTRRRGRQPVVGTAAAPEH